MLDIMAVTGNREEWPNIPEFYAHKDIFITGATGFMGKCLVEKLLRSIPDIRRVMILVRPKREKTVEKRVKAVMDSKVSFIFLGYIQGGKGRKWREGEWEGTLKFYHVPCALEALNRGHIGMSLVGRVSLSQRLIYTKIQCNL